MLQHNVLSYNGPRKYPSGQWRLIYNNNNICLLYERDNRKKKLPFDTEDEEAMAAAPPPPAAAAEDDELDGSVIGLFTTGFFLVGNPSQSGPCIRRISFVHDSVWVNN